MITSSVNQYLRAEYLNPIQGNSIELDAKKSPLALLAQTCSQIGSDGPQKNGTISVEKTPKGKSSPGRGTKSPSGGSMSSDEAKGSTGSSFKPYEKKEEDDRTSPGKRTPGTKSPPSVVDLPRTCSRSSEGGGGSRGGSGPHESTANLSTTSSTSTSSSRGSPLTTKTTMAASHSLSSLGDLSKDPLAAYKLNSSLYPHLGLGLDPLASAGLSALTAKVSSSSGSSSLTSPYIGYARVKTAGGTEVVLPICRDPYCTGCQINTHALQVVNGTCPPACSQCVQLAAHTKALSALPTSLLPTIPSSSLTSLYPPSALLGGSQQYVCNWVSGDTYCGKRFSTSEELLQHLRSHTNLSSSESSSSLSLSPLHHPLLAGHPALPRGYPTPPLSPLSAARYHPYAKASLSHLSHTAPLPSAAAVSALSAASLSALSPHPLSAYYNPYSLYARGLGATAGIHP